MRVEMMISGKGDMPGMTTSKGKSKKQEEEMIPFADVLAQTCMARNVQSLTEGESMTGVQLVASNTMVGAGTGGEAAQVLGAFSEGELLFADRTAREMWSRQDRTFQMKGEAGSTVSIMSEAVQDLMKGSAEAMSPSLDESQQLHGESPVITASRQRMSEEDAVKAMNGQQIEEGEDLEVKREQNLYLQQDIQSEQLEPGQKPVLNIKVAEPYHMVNRDFSEQISDSINHQLEAGTKQYQIQLEPEQLGRIEVEISLGGEHAVVKLSCENQETARLLTENAQTIGVLLESRGTDQIMVEVRQEGEQIWYQQQEGQNHGQGSTGQNGENQNRDHQEKENRKQYEGSDFLDQLRLGLQRNWQNAKEI